MPAPSLSQARNFDRAVSLDRVGSGKQSSVKVARWTKAGTASFYLWKERLHHLLDEFAVSLAFDF